MKRSTSQLGITGAGVRAGAAVLIFLFAMLALSPVASAQAGKPSRNDVSHAIEGDGTQESQNQTQSNITRTLRDLAKSGQLNGDALDVLNGLGGAGNLDISQMQSLLNGENQGIFKEILRNQDLMDAISQQSPTGASFLEDVIAPVISEIDSGGADGILGALNFVLGSPTGGKYTLQGGYTYSDLLPSVFYSKKQNSDGVVNSLQVSVGELSKYPAGDAETYGQMASPDERAGVTDAGSALGKYITGLYDYDWLVTVDNEGNSSSPVGVTFNGDTNATKLGLGMGVIGAKIYEMAVQVITWLSNAFKTINLPTLLGLTDTGDADNWLTNTTRSVLDKMGLTKASIKAIQFLLMVVIGSAFLLVLMASMRSPEKRAYNDSRVKSLGFRTVMIVIAIPFISIFTGVINALTEPGATETYSDAANINSSYVVDTLNWAAVTNMSLSDAGYGAPTDQSDGEAYTPTPESVEGLMNAVDARGLSTGLLPKEEADRDATDLLEALSSGERSNVNAYLAALSRGQSYSFSEGLQSARSQIAAASVPRRGEVITSANHKNMEKDRAGRMIAPYFLSDRATDSEEAGGEESASGASGDADSGDKPDDAAPAQGASDAGAHSKDTLFGANELSGKKYQCNTGAMSCAAVKWNTPSTYIYGADTPSYNSRSYRNFTGEIHDQNVQSNDPGSGEPSEDGVLEANAVSIAMMNRYGGISNINGVPSLSTQSVAFLLQSTYDNGTLRFNGYNTAAEGALGAKNNGAHGTEFLRYTMPNTGQADLLGKIGALAIVWLTSGIIAIVALFALFRAPLLIALLNMFRGLFGALQGKASGVLVYCSYYTALRCAFMFVGAAITLGAHIAAWLVNLTGVNNTIGDAANSARGEQNGTSGGWFADVTGASDTIDSVRAYFSGALTSIATIFVCLLICAIVCWPIFTVPAHKGQVKKLSLISTIVILPFLIADIAGEWIDNLARKVGEKPMKTNTAYAGGLEWINQKEEAGKAAKRGGHIARDAGAVGLAGVTGGTSAVVGGVAGKLAKSAADKTKGETVPVGRDGTKGDGTKGALAGAAGDIGTAVGGGAVGSAVSTAVGAGAGQRYSQVLPNGGVRSGAGLGDGVEVLDKPAGGWKVSSDGEVSRAGATGASIAPMSSNMPLSVSRAIPPEALAGMAAVLGAGMGAAGRGGRNGGDARIGRVEHANIENANITGGVSDAPNAPERGNDPVVPERDVPTTSAREEANPPKRGVMRTTGSIARDMATTAGHAAYSVVDQGESMEKHMEKFANRVTGTTAQERKLPFEKQRESRLDPASMARENKGGERPSAGAAGDISGLQKSLDRMARNLERNERGMRRNENEMRRNSETIRSWKRD